MRLLITGVSGELGGPLFQIAKRTPSIEALGTTHTRTVKGAEKIDLTSEAEVQSLFERLSPTAVIHTALSERSPHFEIGIPKAGEILARLTHENNIRSDS